MNIIRRRLAHRRQQTSLGHRARYRLGLRLVAECAGHAAARRDDRLYRQFRDAFQHRQHAREGAEGLLMAMTVHKRRWPAAACSGRSGFSRARNSLNSNARRGQRLGLRTRQQRSVFVTQSHQAGRFQADHRQIAGKWSSVRRASSRALSTMPADRKLRPQHSGRPRTFGITHAISGGGEHAQRGAQIFRFEPAIERVRKQMTSPRGFTGANASTSRSRNASRRQMGNGARLKIR